MSSVPASTTASTIRNEFQGFTQKLGPPSDERVDGPWDDQERTLHGDKVIISTKQYTQTLDPVDAGHDPRKILHACLLVDDMETSRSVQLCYRQDGESLTRDLTIFDEKGFPEEESVHVGPPGETNVRVERHGYGQVCPMTDLLTPDEKAILGEWNITSLGS